MKHHAFAALAFTGVLVMAGCALDPTDGKHDPAHYDSHAAHAGDAAPAQPQLDDGKPWATDAPLREGMARIRDAVALADAQAPLTGDSAAALADAVEEQVAFLIANCELEPAADATLHVLIARMLSAASMLRADPASAEGLPRLREVLHDYPRYFDHPGWPATDA